MAKIDCNGIVREMTAEELKLYEHANRIVVIKDANRPMTTEEVTAMLITAQINTLSVDDNTALRMQSFYPEWNPNTEYTEKMGKPVGYKVGHGGKLWKLRTEHTSQAGWEPGAIGTESLWEQVTETHNGTIDDPTPYDGNMALVSGLYYYQNGVIYQCNRDTVNPVYNTLAELVGIYVVEV